jgi:hypothetical protein
MMTAGGSTEALIRGRRVISNSILGIIIILLSWVTVDFVLKFVYKPDAVISGTAQLGPWNAIWSAAEDSKCIVARIPEPITTGIVDFVSSVVWSSFGVGEIGSGDCSPESIYSLAAASGQQLTQSQANVLSCIARFESSCTNNPGTARTPNGQSTTASGLLQIVIGINDTCHNLNVPNCHVPQITYVGNPQETLDQRDRPYLYNNCSRAFSNGHVRPGYELLAQSCRRAAADPRCNISAAACLVKQNPSFSDWTADPRSSGQRACIARYGGS